VKHTGLVQAFTVVNTERGAKRKKNSRQEVKEVRNRESNNPRPVTFIFSWQENWLLYFPFSFSSCSFAMWLPFISHVGSSPQLAPPQMSPPSLLPFSPFKTGNVPVLCQMGSPFFFVPPPLHSGPKKRNGWLLRSHLSQPTPQLSRTVQQKPPHCASALPRICTSTKDSTWAPFSSTKIADPSFVSSRLPAPRSQKNQNGGMGGERERTSGITHS